MTIQNYILNFISHRKDKKKNSEDNKHFKESDYDLKCFIERFAMKAKHIKIATHNPKIIHTSSKATSIYRPDLTNANIVDGVGSAASLDVFSFLNTIIDGKNDTLLNLFNKDDVDLIQFFTSNDIDYEFVKQQFLKMQEVDYRSDKFTRQIYLKHGDEYVLGSVLTDTNFIYELKLKINHMRFSDEFKALRKFKKTNEKAAPFQELYGLTQTHVGGTNCQVAGVINNMQPERGSYYYINAVPPTIKSREFKKNVFKSHIVEQERYFFKNYKYLIMLADRYKNKESRDNLNKQTMYFIEQFLFKAFQSENYLTPELTLLPEQIAKSFIERFEKYNNEYLNDDFYCDFVEKVRNLI